MGEIGEQGWRERHIVGEELPWEKEEHGERPGQADTWQLEFGELRGRGLVVDSDQAREAGRHGDLLDLIELLRGVERRGRSPLGKVHAAPSGLPWLGPRSLNHPCCKGSEGGGDVGLCGPRSSGHRALRPPWTPAPLRLQPVACTSLGSAPPVSSEPQSLELAAHCSSVTNTSNPNHCSSCSSNSSSSSSSVEASTSPTQSQSSSLAGEEDYPLASSFPQNIWLGLRPR